MADPLHDSLHDHGDRQVPPGALDLAVNVLAPTPEWLRSELSAVDLAAYPDETEALACGGRSPRRTRRGVSARQRSG